MNGKKHSNASLVLCCFLDGRQNWGRTDDIFASLHADPPGQEFVAVASAVSHVPEFRAADTRKGFGPEITGGSSLDLHLASFNEEVIGRDDPVFMRIARAAGGTSIDFAEVGAVPPVPGDALVFGPAVHDDATLNGQMFALEDSDGRAFDRRERGIHERC